GNGINCPDAAQGSLAADRELTSATRHPRDLPTCTGCGNSPAYGNRFAHRQDRPGDRFVPLVNQIGPKSVASPDYVWESKPDREAPCLQPAANLSPKTHRRTGVHIAGTNQNN